MGRYHAEQLLGESPESLSPGCGFSSHSVMKPTLHLSLFPSVVFRGARHLCWEELLFFHLKVYTKKEKGIPHLARPTHLFLYLFLCTLFSSFVIYPPPPSMFSASCCFLIPSLVSLSCSLVCRLYCWQCRISR